MQRMGQDNFYQLTLEGRSQIATLEQRSNLLADQVQKVSKRSLTFQKGVTLQSPKKISTTRCKMA